jgi:DNA primase
MYLTSHFFEHLRDQISISDVIRQKINLTKRGQEYTGLCPFHSEKTPSFTVNDIKKFYHCFGCGAHGDVIRFVAETSGMAYQEAAIKLAENNGIVVPQPTAAQAKIYEETEEVLRVLAIANQFFVSQLTKQAKDYLYERKITDSEIKEYCIGYVPAGSGLQKYLEGKKIPLKTMYSAGLVGKSESGDIYSIFKNRITFPIKNIYGKIIAFGGRIIGDGHPKYLNSPETMVFKKSDTLYGENIANGAAYHKKRIIVVEGYLDVIAMHSIGFVETVATLGTAITSQHLLKLWKISDEIIFCMDGDDAGIRAMQKVIFTLLPLIKNQNKASFVMLPKGLDPDEVARGYGKTYLEGIINARLAVSEMIWHLETDRKKFTSAESKSCLLYTSDAADDM